MSKLVGILVRAGTFEMSELVGILVRAGTFGISELFGILVQAGTFGMWRLDREISATWYFGDEASCSETECELVLWG